MTLRWFVAITGLAAIGLALLFRPFVESDPLGGVGWFVLVLIVIGALLVLGVASFVIRSLVKSRRAVREKTAERDAALPRSTSPQ